MAHVDLDHLPPLPADRSVGIGCIGAGFIKADCHLVAYRAAGYLLWPSPWCLVPFAVYWVFCTSAFRRRVAIRFAASHSTRKDGIAEAVFTAIIGG